MPEKYPSHFPTTDWQLVSRGRDAVESIFNRYRPALRLHLLIHRQVPEHKADDLLQGFVTSEWFEHDLIGRADPQRGRFRALLRVALNRFVGQEYRKEQAQKRAGSHTQTDVDSVNIRQKENADVFDLEWARQILSQALKNMKAKCLSSDKMEVWTVFNQRVLGPLLHGEEAATYQDLCKTLGLRSPLLASNLLVTAKRMYTRHLRSVIAEYVDNESEIDDEIHDLLRIFSKSRA